MTRYQTKFPGGRFPVEAPTFFSYVGPGRQVAYVER